MHQLEENGVQVALGELDVTAESVPPNSSAATKRKRVSGDEASNLKRKTTPSNSPARNAPIVQDKTVAVVPANSTVSESILPSDVPYLMETSSRVDAVSSTLVQSSLPTKTHTSESGASISSQPSVVESNVVSTTAVPERAPVETSVAKNAVEKRTDAVIPRIVESSLNSTSSRNSPLLPASQTTQKPSQRNSQQATPVQPQVTEPRRTPQSKNVSNVAASSVQPTEDSNELSTLQPHATSIRCVFVNGPCIFTASEDGTVHVYDMATKLLSMRILGHLQPVTWLYAVSLNTPTAEMKTLKAPEYLNQLSLITGSEDTYVRQFSLETGKLLHEKECSEALTCVAGHKILGKLYIGSKEGRIFTYNPKSNVLKTVNFRVIIPFSFLHFDQVIF